MSTTYVAIDVETTGLNPAKDVIIEIAAITFRDHAIVDEFDTLVYPQRDIPPEITRITGITDEMVADAPSMYTVRSQVRSILSDHVLIGHNIDFDLGFLREERLGVVNPCLDTLTLASILVPEAGRFGLEALANYLNLPLPAEEQTHRAGDDAILTIELFLALWERALLLPIAHLEEIVQAGRNIDWPETLFFEEILIERARTAFEDGELRQRGQLRRLFNPSKIEGETINPIEKPLALDVDILADMIRPGGNFSQVFTGFEYRAQQEEMMTAVADALNLGDHVLVEAGTGTGKSIGYLLPAAFWSTQNGRRVVVSTNTINLQDQLIHKDIPLLQQCLPFELRAAVRKGRSNYLCTRFFQQLRRRGPNNEDEMVLYARILLWLPHTNSGDVAELTLRTPGERMVWSRLNGEKPVCSYDVCAAENCPVHIARQRAERAHIVIVNHALLLADLANEGHILPQFVDLIIDEAHHLETAVTNGMSFRADKRFLDTTLDDIARANGGMLANIQGQVNASLAPNLTQAFNEFANRMRNEAQTATMAVEDFFAMLAYFLQDSLNSRSQFAQQVRLTAAARTQPGFDEVEISWDNLNKHLISISKNYTKLAAALLEAIENQGFEEGRDMWDAVVSNGRDLEEARDNLDQIISTPKDEMIYWVETLKDRISLHAAPLHIGPLVEEHIFNSKEAVVLTSATMRTAGPYGSDEATFDYIRDRLHAKDANELAVGSPFDYKNRTLLYLVSDIPEPNQPGYQRYVESAILDVAQALGGRTMVLFTSFSQLKQTAQAIEGPLAAHKIMTLAQLPGTSRQKLLAQFKDPNGRCVLLGTRSFWEGVDVPGPALQALLLVKLPFDVPSDPIFAARSETFDNAFFEYSIPEAVLRFRQGFGRLIRRKDDEGVVAVLDKRVLTKRYGQLFVEALPECTVLRQRNGRLGELTLRWLNRAK
ncbi:MAG: DEAD/DEAH box helicase family protein [Anaerolineales bacterium]|nr:DEAD/DEAH box helicase family protein [Anaerolineales bacterium]